MPSPTLLLLVLGSPAHAVRLTEADFARLETKVAPDVEAITGRTFAEVPPLTLQDSPHIVAAIRASRPGDATSAEQAAMIESLVAEVDADVALYVPGLSRIFVNTDTTRALLKRMEDIGEDPIAHVRCVLAHELTHALQHQYGSSNPDLPAWLAIEEGHASWVQEQVCKGPALQAERATLGLHLLQAPSLAERERRYVVGEAAVSTLLAAEGNEGYWAVLRAGTVTATEIDHLADGARQPGWAPEHFGEGMAFPAAWGPPKRSDASAWQLAKSLLDDRVRTEMASPGPAVTAGWTWGHGAAFAANLSFGTEEAAAAVLAGRRLGLVGGHGSALLKFPPYLTVAARSKLRRAEAPAGSAGGLAVTMHVRGGTTYRELWTRQGRELRVIATYGQTSRKVAGAALLELGSLPAAEPPPGPAAPRAAEVLARLHGLPQPSPTELAADFVISRLAATQQTGAGCPAELARWVDRVSAQDRGKVTAAAARCAWATGDEAGIHELASTAGEGEPWDEANLLFAEAAATTRDWPSVLRYAERSLGLGAREARRDRVLVYAWINLGGHALELRAFARDPLNDDALRYLTISALWLAGDSTTAAVALPSLCQSSPELSVCQGDWRAHLKSIKRGTPLPK